MRTRNMREWGQGIWENEDKEYGRMRKGIDTEKQGNKEKMSIWKASL